MEDILSQNLKWIETLMPSLAHRLSETNVPSAIELLRAESGDWTAKQNFVDGSYRFLHSKIDPKQEAKTWVKSQYVVMPSIIIFGIGLAYHVFVMLRQNSFIQNVYLFEADEGILRLAMTVINFSSLLQNRIVHFMVGSSPTLFPPVNATQPFSRHIFPSIATSNPAVYSPAAQLLEQHLCSIRLRENTGIRTLLHYMSAP